jgi:hypothetical protein
MLNIFLALIRLTDKVLFCESCFSNYFLLSFATFVTHPHTLFYVSMPVLTELSFSSFCTVARAQSEEDAATAEVVEGADLGIVGDDTQVSSDEPLSPAPGVDTVCVFPKNAGKSEYPIDYIVRHGSVSLSLTVNPL